MELSERLVHCAKPQLPFVYQSELWLAHVPANSY